MAEETFMPRIWLFASALVATAGVWHAAHRVEAAAAAASFRQAATLHATQSGTSRAIAIESSGCPFLRAHPGVAAGAPHQSAPAAGATCPFSGKSGRSSISLEDAIELHGARPADAPRDHREATWL